MKYFGGAPSICSLITGTTISHSQRNKVCDNKIAFGITIPKNVPIKYYKYVGFLTTLTKSKGGEMGVGDTSDTTSRDFVSRFKHSVRREQKLPRNSKKRRKGKSSPNVATRSPLIRGDTPYTWGHLTPPYTSRTDLTLLSFVGVFTSSSFSLLPDSSKLVLLDHDYHHLCQNHPHNHHQHQHQHCHHFQTPLE